MCKCQALTTQHFNCKYESKFIVNDVRLCGVHYRAINKGLVVAYVDANKHVKTIDGGRK